MYIGNYIREIHSCAGFKLKFPPKKECNFPDDIFVQYKFEQLHIENLWIFNNNKGRNFG